MKKKTLLCQCGMDSIILAGKPQTPMCKRLKAKRDKMTCSPKQVKPERMPCPLNEFSEHCTGDMPSMDWAWHSWMQDEYNEQRKALERKAKQTNKEKVR